MMFQSKDVNSDRQPFLDLAKTLATVCMVHLHLITYMMPDCSTANPLLYLIANWFTGGVFAAPVFMFCMGIGMVYSRHTEPGQILARGGRLYRKAWVLNLQRAAALWFILWLIRRERELWANYVFFATFIDILQFAALAFFLTALLRKLKLNQWAILGVGAALSVVGSFLRNLDAGNFLLNFIFGHLVGITPTAGDFKTIFPLCNWFIIVAAGQVFGGLLKRCDQPKKLMTLLLCITAPLFAIYNLICLPKSIGIYADITRYYYMDLPTACYVLVSVLFMLSFCYFLCRVLPEKLGACCRYISLNINEIYCFHWIIIINLFYIVGTKFFGLLLNPITLYPATVLVFGASVLLHWVDDKYCRSFFKRL